LRLQRGEGSYRHPTGGVAFHLLGSVGFEGKKGGLDVEDSWAPMEGRGLVAWARGRRTTWCCERQDRGRKKSPFRSEEGKERSVSGGERSFLDAVRDWGKKGRGTKESDRRSRGVFSLLRKKKERTRSSQKDRNGSWNPPPLPKSAGSRLEVYLSGRGGGKEKKILRASSYSLSCSRGGKEKEELKKGQ